MKKPISARIDEKIWVHINKKPNLSLYIEELIKQDIQQKAIKPITESVMQQLLNSNVFFEEMRNRMTNGIPNGSESGIETKESNIFTQSSDTPKHVGGYACCTRKNRCRHWQWDGLKGWVNSLTGEVKEE